MDVLNDEHILTKHSAFIENYLLEQENNIMTLKK
jgi:hypothetical protein